MKKLNIIKLQEGEWLMTAERPKAKDIKVYYKDRLVRRPIVGIIFVGE